MSSSASIKPDNDAANSVTADTRMMHQAQPKSAATRADATTVRSSSWPIRWIRILLGTSFNSGVSIEVVRRRLGHVSTETTQVYTELLADKVADTEIRAARRKREASRG
jgi:site-specific recombinase XerC